MALNVRTLIAQRSSWRTYQPKALEPKDREALEDWCQSPELTAPFPGAWRFKLVASGTDTARKIGTYGTITGAKDYLVGAIQNGPHALLNFGYLMERLVLEATRRGLGTCWLGGSFDRTGFGQSIQACADELVPAVTPVGYLPRQRRLWDRVIRWSAKSKGRKPWEDLFFREDWQHPLTPADAGAFQEPLEAVRLAPSASNRQPWRIVHAPREKAFHFFLQRTPGYARTANLIMRAVDLQVMDLGIAMCHWDLVCAELKLKGRWVQQAPTFPAAQPAPEYLASFVLA